MGVIVGQVTPAASEVSPSLCLCSCCFLCLIFALQDPCLGNLPLPPTHPQALPLPLGQAEPPPPLLCTSVVSQS